VPERGEVWYSDGNSGFYALKATNGVWPFPAAAAGARTAQSTAAAGATASRPQPAAQPSAPPAAAPSAQLAVTGGSVPVARGGAAFVGGFVLLGLRRRLASP